MSVDSTQCGDSPPLSDSGFDQAADAQQDPRRSGTVASPYAADRVRLWPETGSAGHSVGVGSAGLSPERLLVVLDRLRSGFYDTAQVRNLIAQRLQPDL